MGQEIELPTDLEQARALLLDNERILKRKVRRVALEDNEYAEALFTLAAGKKFDWTPESWQAVLDRLDNCHSTVREYLG